MYFNIQCIPRGFENAEYETGIMLLNNVRSHGRLQLRRKRLNHHNLLIKDTW